MKNINRSVRIFLFSSNQKILFVERPAFELREPCKYTLPGGRVENGEVPKAAIIRETFEEVRLALLPEYVVYCGKVDKQSYVYLRTYYYFYNKPIGQNKFNFDKKEVLQAKFLNFGSLDPKSVAFGEYDLLKYFLAKVGKITRYTPKIQG